ncbi:amidohydrolase family protein [Pseudoalteromonas tetraodonis]|uniref:N-acyl-D-amino-acid deacylase family protein n=1 Tax=Pseudoalteromonas tetraodonis TaxID=43659 RepID=UPI001BDE58A4|nr:amidohydrolase family protein [Pseudoalteromonas tetraodonis]MBT2153240.1 amidohydrolase family protein [Pseudoalteromonas tetraodonis]
MKGVCSTKKLLAMVGLVILTGCSKKQLEADYLIINGQVYTAEQPHAEALDIAVCGSKICGVFLQGESNVIAKQTIDATDMIVSPGFIDPHTHSLEELLSGDKNNNLNYLSQGVTTVVNGNDGDGPADIAGTVSKLQKNKIGTNVALLIGHGSVREQVMGRAQQHASAAQLDAMQKLVAKGMQEGALGLSSGLYYVPGSYANTEEVVSLAKVVAEYQGIYDTHMRDESTFNIGFLNAIKESIEIAEQAQVHLHLAHIKALGVDVWGQSEQAIELITQAQQRGVSISADQYPWLASGTKLHSAIMPKWVMADSREAFIGRLNDAALANRLHAEINENIRRRGGPDSLLITAFQDANLVGKTLKEVAQASNQSAVDTAIELVKKGDVRVASFNMSQQDVNAFMQQPWVVTSSDGTNGHPRKYASFPKKYQEYVVNKQLLTIAEFITQSSRKTAAYLGIKYRGVLKEGYAADIIIWDANNFQANADFSQWNKLSTGVKYTLVNGHLVIDKYNYLNALQGKFIAR